MGRTTIDYGIDLGTTNSSIAVIGKNGPGVVPSREGGEITPSAVYVDKEGNSHVGKSAKARRLRDALNTAVCFKRAMGTGQSWSFQRSGLVLNAEQLSAEVLKTLRGDAMVRGEEIDSAVVTVPADFDQPQCHATKRAAKLAGIETSPLLMEPVAAALAYGFDQQSEKAFWLVFDIGGGTFDAALVRVRDGFIQVINQGGDNFLGGTNIDQGIVDQLFVPALKREYNLPGFSGNNPRFKHALNQLLQQAEDAKIHVSSFEKYELDFLHPLGQLSSDDRVVALTDDDGKEVEFEFVLTRSHVSQLIEPIVRRAIEISRRVLREQKLGPADVEKVLLVGGPTLTPHLREMLADPKEGLGIPLEYSINAMTVVAQGAAIFAATQHRPVSTHRSVPTGHVLLQLEYKPVAADTQPLIGGKVINGTRSFEGYTIEFFNNGAKPAWRSGKIRLSREGSFISSLWAEHGRRNTFSIELFDSTGNRCSTEPAEIDYIVAVEPAKATLPHNIGVAMANNIVDVFFTKGDELPLRKKQKHSTTKDLRRGFSDQKLLIPIVEGLDTEEADLNRAIGFMELTASDIPHDVPVGSEVEITLEINESRIMSGSAYIPLVDKEIQLNFEGEDFLKPNPNPKILSEDVARQRRRIDEMSRIPGAVQTGSLSSTDAELVQIRSALAELERQLPNAHNPDALFAYENELLDLKRKLASIERTRQVPTLRAKAQSEIAWTEEVVQAHGSPDDQRNWALLKQDISRALDDDPQNLREKVESAHEMRMRLSVAQEWWWVDLYEYLKTRRSDMSDSELANRWFPHVEGAIANGDFEALKSGCRQLWALLPVEEQRRGYGGTTIAKSTALSSL
jgi:molecular chaperone DnaK